MPERLQIDNGRLTGSRTNDERTANSDALLPPKDDLVTNLLGLRWPYFSHACKGFAVQVTIVAPTNTASQRFQKVRWPSSGLPNRLY
jgi:hypothetical protein